MAKEEKDANRSYLVGIAFETAPVATTSFSNKNKLIKFINVALLPSLHGWILANIQAEDGKQLNRHEAVLSVKGNTSQRVKRSNENSRWIGNICPWVESCDGKIRCNLDRQYLPGRVPLKDMDCLDWKRLPNQTSEIILECQEKELNRRLMTVQKETVMCRTINCMTDEMRGEDSLKSLVEVEKICSRLSLAPSTKTEEDKDPTRMSNKPPNFPPQDFEIGTNNS